MIPRPLYSQDSIFQMNFKFYSAPFDVLSVIVPEMLPAPFHRTFCFKMILTFRFAFFKLDANLLFTSVQKSIYMDLWHNRRKRTYWSFSDWWNKMSVDLVLIWYLQNPVLRYYKKNRSLSTSLSIHPISLESPLLYNNHYIVPSL